MDNKLSTPRTSSRRSLLTTNCAFLIIGSLTSSLLSRFYFVHGGSSRWFSTFVQSAGFPLLLLPISLTKSSSPHPPFSRRLLALSLIVGLFLGINNFLISWGVSYLPVSTSSLLLSSQLAFNLVLSVLIVGQKLRSTNVNCVVLLTSSSLLLALGASNDRPAGVTTLQFFLGFVSILGAAGMFALYLPVMEVIYREVTGFRMVMEMQVLMEAVATAFATVGMAASGEFQRVRREAAVFDAGRGAYWAIVVSMVVSWQLVFMGTAGMVFLTSSLNSGICTTALLSINVAGGVLVFRDVFEGQKAVAMVLCVWGFASYLYGEHKRMKEEEGNEMESGGNANGESGGGERV